MDKPKIRDHLEQRLQETVGRHTQIAAEAGVSQSALSRFFRGESDIRLGHAQKLIDWFDADDVKNGRPRRSAFFAGDAGGVARRRRRVSGGSAPAPLGR